MRRLYPIKTSVSRTEEGPIIYTPACEQMFSLRDTRDLVLAQKEQSRVHPYHKFTAIVVQSPTGYANVDKNTILVEPRQNLPESLKALITQALIPSLKEDVRFI